MNDKFAVRYWSRTGNTKKLALAIGEALECETETVEYELEKSVDVLFLGAAIYGGRIDGKVEKFLNEIDENSVDKIVVFSTSAYTRTAQTIIYEIIKDKNIEVDEKNFYCVGRFLLAHLGKPDEKDLEEAQAFAKSYL